MKQEISVLLILENLISKYSFYLKIKNFFLEMCKLEGKFTEEEFVNSLFSKRYLVRKLREESFCKEISGERNFISGSDLLIPRIRKVLTTGSLTGAVFLANSVLFSFRFLRATLSGE